MFEGRNDCHPRLTHESQAKYERHCGGARSREEKCRGLAGRGVAPHYMLLRPENHANFARFGNLEDLERTDFEITKKRRRRAWTRQHLKDIESKTTPIFPNKRTKTQASRSDANVLDSAMNSTSPKENRKKMPHRMLRANGHLTPSL